MLTRKILIVEDNPPERELYTEVLEGEGFSVDAAGDGEEALERLAKNHYELVLLDVNLPKISGLKVLEELRNSSENGKARVLIISNLDESVFLRDCQKLGISGYLIKADHTPDQVVAKVKGILDEKG